MPKDKTQSRTTEVDGYVRLHPEFQVIETGKRKQADIYLEHLVPALALPDEEDQTLIGGGWPRGVRGHFKITVEFTPET